jgi:hypothetical protein
MRAVTWEEVVGAQDARWHRYVDVVCALFIGLGLGGLIVYWQLGQMTTIGAPTAVVESVPENQQVITPPTTGEGNIWAPTGPSEPKVQEI